MLFNYLGKIKVIDVMCENEIYKVKGRYDKDYVYESYVLGSD